MRGEPKPFSIWNPLMVTDGTIAAPFQRLIISVIK
jgi:hypothetical protein